ncbi:WYL domain-containing protein [Streptomyces viridifaciens]|nr:WYL domain-containing protein [Streptomyces viridifaciens]UKZ03922.1 WYL domain-containing protein [Streptomyces viridifaciens]
MPRPTARVLTLLELLQSGGTRTVAELAERLGVQGRTVRRYVDHLIELDVPVESVRGRYGGYRLAPGYRLPPLMLGDDEALAVLLGLLAARRTALTAAQRTANETAAAKIRRVLPRHTARRLDALQDTVAHTEAPDPSEGPVPPGPPGLPGAGDCGTPDAEILLTVADAVRHRRPLALGYTDREGRSSERTLHAHGIVNHAGRWYLTGTDTRLDEERTFRLDRVTGARTLPGTFREPADPVGPGPAQRLLTGFATADYRHRVTLRIQATPEHIRAHLPASVAELTGHGPSTVADGGAPGQQDWLRVELRAQRLDWLPPVLAALDRPFVIERPDELRDLVNALADRLARGARASGA